MCWTCDHPGATQEDYRDHIRTLIGQYGLAVQGVERDGSHPPWAYTVGLTSLDLPELVVTGMDLPPAAQLLNQAAALSRTPGVITPGAHIRSAGKPHVQVIEVTRPWAHLNVAVSLYGESIRALQLVHADASGRWPWVNGYHGIPGGQPVLGTRP